MKEDNKKRKEENEDERIQYYGIFFEHITVNSGLTKRYY